VVVVAVLAVASGVSRSVVVGVVGVVVDYDNLPQLL